MKLIIAGGGTGGHLFPGIAVAEEFLERDRGNQVLFVGTANGIEARAVPADGYRLELISAAGIRGKGGLSQIKGALMMLKGFVQSCRLLKCFQPELVLGVGGYASLPMLLAARFMKIPCFIHEQNAIPGKTNRLLGRLVDKIFITVEESEGYFDKAKTVLTGNPLRRQILEGRLSRGPVARDQNPGNVSSGSEFNLLVFGGSQGAHAINSAMVASLPILKESGLVISITHQTGTAELEEIREKYRQLGINGLVTAFIYDMAAAYRQADLVICRAGATTIAELSACSKPALFIPFPHAVDDHQRLNAEALVSRQAGFMLLERDLSGETLAAKIKELVQDRQLLDEAGRLAFGLARLDAAKLIVDKMMGDIR